MTRKDRASIVNTIEEMTRQGLTRAEIAHELDLKPTNISMIYKTSTGKTIRQLQNEVNKKLDSKDVISFLQTDLQVDPYLNIESAYGYTEIWLNPEFKKSKGHTIKQYRKKARLGQAKTALNNFSEVKVAQEIAGYKNGGHFTKDFEKENGTKPGEYRELCILGRLTLLLHEHNPEKVYKIMDMGGHVLRRICKKYIGMIPYQYRKKVVLSEV